jgi:hypothetical protein
VDNAVSTKAPSALSRMAVTQDIGHLSLEEAYNLFIKDDQSGIPFRVWLFENPGSPLALPGNVNLYGHDCIHLLLNRGMSIFDEAFVIGFTMGNCNKVKNGHLALFKLLSQVFYPAIFRFREWHLKIFDLGVMYGQQLKYKDINSEKFEHYFDLKINDIRQKFGILPDELHSLWQTEQILVKEFV